MTICLAAISKEGDSEYIVFATDHMITTPLGQFEHRITKYRPINNSTVAMLAGNPLIFDELIKLTDEKLSYNKIKQEIFFNFKRIRKSCIKHEILDMFGVDENFVINALNQEIHNPFIGKILEKVSNYSLQSGILLIGFDGTEAQITEISEENYQDFRMMNFHAIGSGNIQAMNAMLFQKHGKEEGLLATVYDVFKAKKNAEVLQGVGKETDVIILCKGEGCKKISSEDLNILQAIYDSELKLGKDNPQLKKLRLGGLNAQQKL